MPMMALMDSLDNVSHALDAALAVRDTPTHDHSLRVLNLATGLGRACGLSHNELKFLVLCAKFHDIGKIGIPDRILHKPGKLTQEEFSIIRQHTSIGASIIRQIPLPNIEILAKVIEHHHERYDGKGYPAGLSGDDIPIQSRIIAVVDSYDAITSRRSYHEAQSCENALGIIDENRGTQFDPELAEIFVGIAENYDTQFHS